MANRGGQTLFAPHASLEEKRRAFFKDYCVECHNEQKQKGKLRLDNISFALDSVENADRWQKILNQINPGEMPLARPATIPRARVAEMGPKGNSSMDFGSRRPLLADVDADPKLR
ncbi:MAG: c-type cytochrome domain-containing protein [Verrucomicrobiota bacterium]